jgi:SDR family mycofactocin-dependent oxidoreductase
VSAPEASLHGKVALVTGAARGQGRSHAVRLARAGADVIAIDVCAPVDTVPYPASTSGELAETAALAEAEGRRARPYEVDVRDLPALRSAVDAGVADLGRLDIVVANAGIATYAPVTELTEDEWDTMIGVNLGGVWRTVAAAVPHIQRGGEGGSVVITSSASGLRGIPNAGHYAAAKHGVVGLMKVMALELGRESIRVNTIHPSTVNTPMVQNEATLELFLPGVENPTQEAFERIARRLNVMPTPWLEPSDVSDLVVFLASDAAKWITGASIPVDAGMAARW